MNNETLNRLNTFVDGYKEELAEKDAIIKRQNQTLLHIRAELEAIKQYDPFDLVLIAGSIENISNVIKGETDPIFDEGCIGCAGPCMVVDVAANLQKELDSAIGHLVDSRKRCDYLGAQIDDLKDSNIEDLKELYDIYEEEISRLKHIISARDLTIKSLTTMCQSSGTERNGLQKEIDRMEKVHANRKAHIHNLTSPIEDQKRTIDHFINCIGGLEAELSARKEDSAVLMKVVEAVRQYDGSYEHGTMHTFSRVFDLLVDYLDAPEGPPETPIDDLYKVTVSYAILEMP